MVKAECIKKFREKNRICGYRLRDTNGKITDIKPESLKNAIRNGQIIVSNLKLTSDNRLIDTFNQQNQGVSQQNASLAINKAKLLGAIYHFKSWTDFFKVKLPTNTFKEIPTACGHKCYIVESVNGDYTLYIPDDVVALNYQGTIGADQEYKRNIFFNHAIRDIKNTIKVVGGHGLKNAEFMFYGCHAELDLSSFDTSNVTNMSGMFNRYVGENNLDLSYLNTGMVTIMSGMFDECKAKSINLTSFDTHNVIEAWRMFACCEAQTLDLTTFDISNARNIRSMFERCNASKIDCSSFHINKDATIEDILSGCNSKIITDDERLLQEYNNRH